MFNKVLLVTLALTIPVVGCAGSETSDLDKDNGKVQKETFAASPKLTSGDANPLSDFKYTADPTAVVYEGRVYVYGTNDNQQFERVGEDGKNTYEHIRSLVMFSSDDMVNWTYHGTIEVGSISQWTQASWAPSITSRKEEDGKTHFYLYYSNSGNGVGVLTATSPVGPWTDPLGKNVVDRSTQGLGDCAAPFDPGVVIDDQGIGWLSFGGGDKNKSGTDYMPGNARIVRLSKDMTGLDSEIVELNAPYHFEANELDFINGTWIYTYNTNWKDRTEWPYTDIPKPTACSMCYMTSKTPLDKNSWVFRDNYFKNPGDYGMSYSNNHTHLCKFKGEYYLFYHALCLQDSRDIKGGFRSICVDKVRVDEESLKYYMGEGTTKGVSQVQPLNPFITQQAETVAATLGIEFQATDIPGNMVALGSKEGQCIMVRKAEFATAPTGFDARVKGKGKIEVRLDNPEGTVIASIDFDNKDWKIASAKVQKNVNGLHNLCFVFGKGNFEFDEWKFIK
ncbi:glycoside hydrolase family 43 protein [Bacteroides sp.]|uniref:glycoside hydrolase family 43 protein n=1 Tax=Bacteroides sp. TaxID=29523 RepID=UPI00261E5056|nr:glycoside hydrolase family 43 protein [Bacteroides sp.]